MEPETEILTFWVSFPFPSITGHFIAYLSAGAAAELRYILFKIDRGIGNAPLFLVNRK